MIKLHPKKILQIVALISIFSLILSILAVVMIYVKSKEAENIVRELDISANETDKNLSVDSEAEKKKIESSTGSSNLNDRDSKRSLYALSIGLETYYKENRSYPVANSLVNVDDEASPLVKLAPKYYPRIYLKAPKDGHFTYRSDGKNYELSAVLEDKSDRWCVIKDGSCVYQIKNGVIGSKK